MQPGAIPTLRMPLALKAPLLTVFPAGLLGWFPSLALLGKPPFDLPGYYPAIIAVALAACAAYFFRKGLHYYVKKGINRYLAIDIAVDVRSVVKVFTNPSGRMPGTAC